MPQLVVGTIEELDKSHSKAYALVDRATFYAAAKEAMAAARQRIKPLELGDSPNDWRSCECSACLA